MMFYREHMTALLEYILTALLGYVPTNGKSFDNFQGEYRLAIFRVHIQ